MAAAYTLDDAEARAARYPDSFQIPNADLRARVRAGDLVKLLFMGADAAGEAVTERMWVVVVQVTDAGYQGTLDNDPTRIQGLSAGTEISFEPRHICGIWIEGDDAGDDWTKRMRQAPHSFEQAD